MWNLRNAIRSFSGRLKTGNCVPSTSREGRPEFEDDYKHWTSTIWSNECSKLPRIFLSGSDHFGRDNKLIFTSYRRGRADGKDSKRDPRNDWNASDVQSGWTTWLEALGWGAVLGLGLNVLLPKQEELLRRRTIAEDGVPCRYSPRWFTNVALLMPNGTQPSVINSVLPTTGSSSFPKIQRRDSVTWDLTSSSNTSYESETDSEASAEHSAHPKPAYTSETAALLSIMRQQLTTTARDYIAELQGLLSPPSSAVSEEQTAQEEFTLGLFHELGIGVKRDSDEAFKHYVEAAFLHHPGAIQNLVSLHQHSSSFGVDDVSSSVHRSASSPVLSAAPSHYGSSNERLTSEGLSSTLERKQRKFWVSEEESGESTSSSSTLSRSSSFPNLPLAVACV
ncbi:hypothetical protein RvY_12094 [Ramazzottius varieornatus]|uniref:Uncharacterized protein n=1 Tax=Ramazzottius varieornatus TaxID=947166 RepID=A0A1D1VID1_RAMVA|nr:hypothetical protein RvY_12094 [Ramazzottius varieornatus]